MDLNEYDFTELDKLALAIDLTLEMTDLYISGDMLRTFRMIIRKLKRDK